MVLANNVPHGVNRFVVSRVEVDIVGHEVRTTDDPGELQSGRCRVVTPRFDRWRRLVLVIGRGELNLDVLEQARGLNRCVLEQALTGASWSRPVD